MLILSSFITKLTAILGTFPGQLLAFLLFLLNVTLNFLTGFEMNLTIITFIVVLDAIWGIARSAKQHKFAKSELMRETFSKLVVYGSLLFVFIGIDRISGWEKNWSCDIISALICLVEVYSILGNILIVYPKFPVLCLLRRFVIGEIASKLNMNEEEVKEYLSKH